jgi:hypothetical protein
MFGLGLGRLGKVSAKGGGASIILNFLAGIVDPRVGFNRPNTATYTDASGDIQAAAVDVPRIDHSTVSPYRATGLMIEGATDVFYTQSLDLNFLTQSYAVADGGARSPDSAYVNVSISGTWSIYLSADIAALDGTALQFGNMTLDVGAATYTLTVGATSSTGGTTATGAKVIVVTYDGTTATLSVGGAAITSVTADWVPDVSLDLNFLTQTYLTGAKNTMLTICALRPVDVTSAVLIDQLPSHVGIVRVYTTALTAAQVAAL